MKILAIDTSSKRMCVGLADGDTEYSYDLELGRKLSSLLVPTLARLIDSAGWKPKTIDYFACGQGPGSFTGVRVGMATIKGLAWSLGRPVVGLGSLDIVARNAIGKAQSIVSLIDAKRNLLYWSMYKTQGSRITRIAPYMLTSPGELIRAIHKAFPLRKQQHLALVGDGVGLYQQALRSALGHDALTDKDLWQPAGRHCIALARESIKQNKTTDAFSLKPLYLYPKECQIRLQKPKKAP